MNRYCSKAGSGHLSHGVLFCRLFYFDCPTIRIQKKYPAPKFSIFEIDSTFAQASTHVFDSAIVQERYQIQRSTHRHWIKS